MALGSEETPRLRRTLRDLVALSGLSAVWVDREPARIAEDLAEVLLRMLDLEFSLVRLTGLGGESTSEVVRAFQPSGPSGEAETILQALAPWLDTGAAPPSSLPNPVGAGWVQPACLPIGYRGEYGVFVAGSRQAGFPTNEDSLLIGIALNQAAVMLQRQRTELAIQEGERTRRRMAALVEGCEDAVISKNLDGLIESWNPGAERLYGYAAEEILGKPITDLIPPEHPDEFPAILARIARGERIAPYETVRVRKDGKRIDVSVTISPIRDVDGAIVGASAIARDVTEHRRAERLRTARRLGTQILSEADSVREASPRLLRAICDSLGWDMGALWMVDPEARVLRCGEIWVQPSSHVPEFEAITRQSTFETGIGLPGRIWASGQPAWITDVRADPNFPRGPVAHREGLRGAFGFPIRLGANVLGVIEFFSQEIRQPDADLLDTAAIIGGQVGQFLERRRAEEALRESEERFRLLAELVPSIIWTAAPDGAIIYVNDRWFRYTGLTPEQNAHDWPRYVLHPDDRERCVAQWSQALAEGAEYEIEVRNRRHDGEYRWFLTRAAPTRDAEGRVTAWFGSTTDIDDRKRAETAQRFLAEVSEALVQSLDSQTILQRVADLAVPTLADFCFIDVVTQDGRIERIGRRHRCETRQPFFDQILRFTPPRDPEQDPAFRVLRTGEPERVPEVTEAWMQATAISPEHLQFMRDLQLRSLMTVPLIVADRKLGALTFCYLAESGRRYTPADLSLAQELAHRVSLAVENARLYARLQETDRRKDEFMAMLGHELRNPLAPIRNATHLLKRMEPAEPDRMRAIEIIARQVTHQVRLVDDLLDVSRISRGKIRLQWERLDLVTLVRDTSEDCRSLFEEAGVTLALELPAEPVWVEGDATRLAQVLGNLLQNAAKFTDRGGRVAVRLAVESLTSPPCPPPRSEEGGKQISVLAPDLLPSPLRGGAGGEVPTPYAILTVKDTGVGIAPEMLSHLFESFAQADHSLDRSRGGLGLGLALVKGLVELHRGEVRAESSGIGHGSTFTVLLPVAPAPAAAASLPPRAAVPARPSRILIVEDYRDAAESLRDLLELTGCEVELAASGPEALEVARRFRPEVVLCDLGLPGMSGYEVAATLRQDPAMAKTRLIALSGYGQEEDQRRARETGFDVHLTKPVEFEVLQRLLVQEKGSHTPT